MKSTIPGKIVDPCGSFEEDDRSARRRRRLARHTSGSACDLEIIESTDNSALNALFEEFVEHNLAPQSYQQMKPLRVCSIVGQGITLNRQANCWLAQSPAAGRLQTGRQRCTWFRSRQKPCRYSDELFASAPRERDFHFAGFAKPCC